MSSKPSFLNFYGVPPPKSSQKPTQPIQQSTVKQSSSKSFQPNVEEMKWVFDKFDTNKDGKISRQEYKAALRSMGKGLEEAELAKSFEATDIDGDGSIDFKEFMAMMHSMGGVKANDIESAFRVFDLNGNGKISAEELMEVLKRMGERSSLDACKKMIAVVDRDGDGSVDMDEFMTMMTRTLKLC